MPRTRARRARRTRRMTKVLLDALTEEATVDSCNDEEQITGFFTVIEDKLELPFDTRVLGVQVTVVRVEPGNSGEILARCRRGPEWQQDPLLSLLLPSPPPAGCELIEAHRRLKHRGQAPDGNRGRFVTSPGRAVTLPFRPVPSCHRPAGVSRTG